MRSPDLESFERFGTRGIVSGRPFNPGLAGGSVENLTVDGVTISREGIVIVEKHISRFNYGPANDVMISRLKKIANKGLLPEKCGLNYYTHECHEYQRRCNSGWGAGEPNDLDGYELWGSAHTAALEDLKIKGIGLFHPNARK